MLTKTLPFLIIVVFIGVACMPVTAAEDYFDKITLFSDGRITRFTRMPIRVYISPILKESPYLPEIRYAMNEWETALEGKIDFEETDVPTEADIRVSWAYSNLLEIQDTRLGSAELTRLEHKAAGTHTPSFKVEIILILEGDGTIDELSEDEMRTVCLHEFGHAIGLWGHSPHPADVSYPTAIAQRPTARDINTVIRLYNTPLNTSQHDIAIDALKAEAARKPWHLRAHYLLGTVYFDKGEFAASIGCFQECRRLKPNFQPAIERLLQAYKETGQTSEAINLLEERLAQKLSPSDYNTLGILYYQRNENEKAIYAFEKALEIAPYHKAARRNLHQLLREKGFKALNTKDFSTATAAFEKALHIKPLDAPTYRLIGNGYDRIQQFQKAIGYYQKALDINPVDALTQQHLAHCYNNYGVALRNRGEWDEAINAYRNALRLMSTLDIARTNLSDAFWRKGNAYREAGKLDEAITVYQELQTLHPNDTHIYSLLGELYLNKEDYRAALEAFQYVYTVTPNAEHAQHNLIVAYHHYAQSLIHQEHYNAAIQLLGEALRIAPNDPNLRLSLANAYQNMRDYQQASVELSRVLAQMPDNEQAKQEQINLQIRRGNELMQQRNYGEALAEFEAIPPGKRDIQINNTLAYLYLLQGEHVKALAGFEVVLQQDRLNMPAYRNLLALESQLARRRSNKRKSAELVRVRCTLAICLMYRKQHNAAIAKYQEALKTQAAHLSALLAETGERLADLFLQRNDLENQQLMLRWVEELNHDR